jgi:hypothetical protein
MASALPLPQDQSQPALVDVVAPEELDIPEPIIQNIEDISVAGLSDIKVTQTADGRVRVTGISDSSNVVIGTFSSAVFTSAMLADIESGMFEVVSPRPLEPGDHEVVIYSTRPDENSQSAPAKLKFKIVETARAAAAEVDPSTLPGYNGAGIPPETPVPQDKKFPLLPVAGGVLAIIVVGVAIGLRKKTTP